MVILKLKNIQSGKTIDERVRAGEEIDIVRVDKREMQYLYREDDSFHFMDTETFEQIEVPEDAIGEPAKFLKDNTMADILFYDENKILGVEIPVHMILEVTEASIAVRGDTATNVLKQVTLETGAIVQVPGFVNQGDTIKIDTRTGQYIERM
jgi:elongation factor P